MAGCKLHRQGIARGLHNTCIPECCAVVRLRRPNIIRGKGLRTCSRPERHALTTLLPDWLDWIGAMQTRMSARSLDLHHKPKLPSVVFAVSL